MSRIKGKGTRPEVLLRHALFSYGLRYMKNDRRYPGSPDILLPKYRTAIFVNGCFWHSHENCRYATRPKSNVEFWDAKLERNRKRDAENHSKLNEMGFRVIVVWQCAFGDEDKFAHLVMALHEEITTGKACYVEFPPPL